MKNYKLYMLIPTLLLLLTACNSQPTPPKQATNAYNGSQFERMYDFENDYRKVFRNCFETSRIDLSNSCQIEINNFIKDTPRNKKRNIIIEVHTDKSGTDEQNLAISNKRAFAVADAIDDTQKIYSKIYYTGLGEEHILYDADTPEANNINRRVIISVKEANAKIDSQDFTLYVKPVKNKKSKKQISKKKISKKTTFTKKDKLQKLNIKKYTGKADTGWIYFGNEKLKRKFDISCFEDKPRNVKQRTIKGHKKNEFMSNIYKKKFQAEFKEFSFTISPISIFDDGYLPEHNPNIILTHPNKFKTILTTTVNAYNGEKGILYRIFVNNNNSKNKMECLDLIIPYKTGEVEYGMAYFMKNGHLTSKKLH
jgi:outer membrane protein OmpA-like peptidoglycan-associated protein